jgi:hypothetical protein
LQDNTFLIEIMKRCMDTEEVDKRMDLLQYLNDLLPTKYKVQLPTFITNDYIDKALYVLEERFDEKLLFSSDAGANPNSNTSNEST